MKAIPLTFCHEKYILYMRIATYFFIGRKLKEAWSAKNLLFNY